MGDGVYEVPGAHSEELCHVLAIISWGYRGHRGYRGCKGYRGCRGYRVHREFLAWIFAAQASLDIGKQGLYVGFKAFTGAPCMHHCPRTAIQSACLIQT